MDQQEFHVAVTPIEGGERVAYPFGTDWAVGPHHDLVVTSVANPTGIATWAPETWQRIEIVDGAKK